MNDLFSSSSSKRFNLPVTDRQDSAAVDMASSGDGEPGADLDKLFEDVESIKEELRELEAIRQLLHASHENSKNLSNAKAVKELRSRMDGEVTAALMKAKVVKVRLEALDRSNAANRGVPGCGPGSSSDRTRTSVVNGVRKNLKDTMESFNKLREKISSEYRETVQRRYFTVTGDNPDDLTLDRLISTGESETFLQKAIQEQGKGQVLDTIQEIKERHDAVKDIHKNLVELHHLFLDMAVLVETQGEQVNDIEGKVKGAHSFIRRGNVELHEARNYQKSSRNWACCGIGNLCARVCCCCCAG